MALIRSVWRQKPRRRLTIAALTAHLTPPTIARYVPRHPRRRAVGLNLVPDRRKVGLKGRRDDDGLINPQKSTCKQRVIVAWASDCRRFRVSCIGLYTAPRGANQHVSLTIITARLTNSQEIYCAGFACSMCHCQCVNKDRIFR